jgi:26S proteasome regulatory subunit N3
VTAKTGQSLIASQAFQTLPEAPKVAVKETEEMEVDAAPAVSTSTTEAAKTDDDASGSKDKEAGEKPKPAPKKVYAAPVDPVTGDLLLEGTVYLRLLLILANLDASNVKLVSSTSRCLD